MAKDAGRSPATTRTKTKRQVKQERRAEAQAANTAARLPRAAEMPDGRLWRDPTPEDVLSIIEEMATGVTCMAACRERTVSHGKVIRIIANDENLMVKFLQARMAFAHVVVEQNLEDALLLTQMNMDGDGASAAIAVAKHLSDTRRWTAEKFNFGAYGTKVTNIVEGGDNPVTTVNRQMSEEEAAEAYRETRKRKGA